MCGRFTLTLEEKELASFLMATLALPESEIQGYFDLGYKPRYNIVPTNYIPIIRNTPTPTLSSAHWWLLPKWGASKVKWRVSKAGTKTFSWIGPPQSHFNSKFATITSPTNRYWNGLLDKQRCLVPADGFMEWRDQAMLQPGEIKFAKYYFLDDHEPYFFPGLCDEAIDDEGRLFLSANLITVEPNELLKSLPHHRMPAILRSEDIQKWLDPNIDAKGAQQCLITYPVESMGAYQIGPLANSGVNDSREVIRKIAP
jgi:putative SOS response-associated peptidase YedK